MGSGSHNRLCVSCADLDVGLVSLWHQQKRMPRQDDDVDKDDGVVVLHLNARGGFHPGTRGKHGAAAGVQT